MGATQELEAPQAVSDAVDAALPPLQAINFKLFQRGGNYGQRMRPIVANCMYGLRDSDLEKKKHIPTRCRH